jgi:hypothetical protein
MIQKKLGRFRMPIAQRCIFGLSLNWKGPINICPKVSCCKDMGILRIKVADRIII